MLVLYTPHTYTVTALDTSQERDRDSGRKQRHYTAMCFTGPQPPKDPMDRPLGALCFIRVSTQGCPGVSPCACTAHRYLVTGEDKLCACLW